MVTSGSGSKIKKKENKVSKQVIPEKDQKDVKTENARSIDLDVGFNIESENARRLFPISCQERLQQAEQGLRNIMSLFLSFLQQNKNKK